MPRKTTTDTPATPAGAAGTPAARFGVRLGEPFTGQRYGIEFVAGSGTLGDEPILAHTLQGMGLDVTELATGRPYDGTRPAAPAAPTERRSDGATE